MQLYPYIRRVIAKAHKEYERTAHGNIGNIGLNFEHTELFVKRGKIFGLYNEIGLDSKIGKIHLVEIAEAPIVDRFCGLIAVTALHRPVIIAELNENERYIVLRCGRSKAIAGLVRFAGLAADAVFVP